MKNCIKKYGVSGVALGFAVCGILLNGCGSKPVSLENVADLGINNQILETRYSFVPQDSFLANSNWVYSIEAKPQGEYLFANDQMVKVFLLAHNTKRIVIFGNERKIEAYKTYFENNGVKANIRTQPIDLPKEYENYIKIIFFNSTIDDGGDYCRTISNE